MTFDWSSLNWTAIAAIGGPTVAVVAVYLAYRLQIRAISQDRLTRYFGDTIVDLTAQYRLSGVRIRFSKMVDEALEEDPDTSPTALTKLLAASKVARTGTGISAGTHEVLDTTDPEAFTKVMQHMQQTLNLLDERISPLEDKVYRGAEAAFLVRAPKELTDEIEAIEQAISDITYDVIDDNDRKRNLDTLEKCGKAIGELKGRLKKLRL